MARTRASAKWAANPARGLWEVERGRGPLQEAGRPVGTRGFDAPPGLPRHPLGGGNNSELVGVPWRFQEPRQGEEGEEKEV